MSDKEYREQKKRVQALAKKWIQPAGFGWHSIELIYDRNLKEGYPHCVGECSSMWEYNHANITFYLKKAAELKDDELEQSFVHELAHILTDPFAPSEDDREGKIIWEKITDDIARHLVWTAKHVK